MTPNHVTQMHNPPHPGEFIEGVYLEPCGLSIAAGSLSADPNGAHGGMKALLAGTACPGSCR